MKIIGAKIRNIHKLCNVIEQTTNEDEASFNVKIPHYQRPYEWGSIERMSQENGNMIEALFDDYYENSKLASQDKEYFMGTIVAVKNNENLDSTKVNDKEIAIDIIDGQQRLTTIFLLNILRFICSTNYIKYLFSENKFADLKSEIEKFLIFYNKNIETGSINKERVKEFSIELKNNWKNIDDKTIGEKTKEDFKNKFNDIFSIDVFDNNKYYSSFYDFLQNVEFSLKYDYDKYNNIIKEVISKTRISISGNDLEIQFKDYLENNNQDTEIKKVSDSYYNALQCLFIQIKNRSLMFSKNEINAYENYRIIAEAIETMTNNIVVCIMLTENEEDAYTLFEVVNDRFMAVNKIDLIKNLFYKKFVNSSKNVISNSQISKTIENLNKLWTEKISELKNNQTSLILLIAISYITSDNNIEFADTKRYKKSIEEFLNRLNTYNDVDIEKHFNIIKDSYELCKHFYDNGNIAINNLANKSIQSELKNNCHLYYKTFHLLRALKQDSVVPALTNIILEEYYIYKTNNNLQIGIDAYLNDIKSGKIKNQNIDEISINLNKMSLFSKNHLLVRNYAKTVISSKNPALNTNDLNKATNEFANNKNDGWIDSWQYGKNDHKIRVLFNRLYNTNKDNNTGTISFSNSINISLKFDMQDLDHLDAKTVPINATSALYYAPNDPNRKDIINALGNIMLLDKSQNVKKSDDYLEHGLTYYKNQQVAGVTHWLINEIDSLLNKYNNVIKVNNSTVKVPTIDFFNERKKKLIDYFKLVINNQPVI